MYWYPPDDQNDPTFACIGSDWLTSHDLLKLELARARGALAFLKAKIGNERMQELLKAELRQTADRTSEWARLSEGGFQTGVLELVVPGPNAHAFHRFFMQMMKENGQSDLRAAHPDHFMNVPLGGTGKVIENVGGDDLPWFIQLEFTDDPARFPSPWNDDYPERLGAIISNMDGVLIGSAMHEMRDGDDGTHIRLTINLPKAAPPELVRGHLEHFAVEFSNWTRRARDDAKL